MHTGLLHDSSYLGFTLVSSALVGGLIPLWLSLIIVVVMSMAGVAILGVIVERAAYRPLRRSSRLTAVVSAIGVSIFLQNAVMLIWGRATERILRGLCPV